VRLTLRTLLAYLDDTLAPSEIKQIGQKVAESDAAQELIARLKQVTRRRRLTTPPATGPGARFDANDIAEYLDNELDADKVAELEKTCLESDVHLAEIAACHQILTLVLGEPALVPPTARERMYGLVQGREAIPFRKAAPAAGAAAAAGADHEGEESFLMGLPLYRRHGAWLRWALPLGALALFVALGVALWKAIPRQHEQKQVASNGTTNPPPVVPVQGATPEGDKAAAEKAKEGAGAANKDKGPDQNSGKPVDTDTGKKPATDQNAKPPDINPPPVGGQQAERTPAPSKERAELGSYFVAPKSAPTILVRYPEGGDAWKRVAPGARVASNEPLVSLPGYASELRLDSKVRVLLRGHVREFSVQPVQDYLVESSVVLHKPAQGVDADLTLNRGRVYLSNGKESGPAVVRLRFDKEAWDLTLREPGTEVGVDLIRAYTPDTKYREGEGPEVNANLCVTRGHAGLKIDTFHYSNLQAPPGPALFLWDNVGPGGSGPQPLEAVPPAWLKDPPKTDVARDMGLALQEQSGRMVGTNPIEVALLEGLQVERPASRLLAVYSLGAIDETRKLVEILGDGDPAHYLDRDTAVFTLMRWISRGPEQERLLYDAQTRGGLLKDMKYRSNEAALVFDLLHKFDDLRRAQPETFEALAEYMRNKDRVAIAELGFWHLRHMSRGAKLPQFNAAWPLELREKAAADVKKLVSEGKLPPPAAPQGPPAGRGAGPAGRGGATPMPPEPTPPRRPGLNGPGVKPGS
jgi:hypothetical protein